MATAARSLEELVDESIELNETGTPPPDPFADGVFVDFTMPRWRLQAGDREGLVAPRRRGHPGPTTTTGRIGTAEKSPAPTSRTEPSPSYPSTAPATGTASASRNIVPQSCC